MIIAVARPGAGRPITVQLLHVLAVQALCAGPLEGGIALALPLHRAELALLGLPIVGEIAGGGAGRVVPVGRALRRIAGGVGVAVGGVLLLLLGPQRRRRHRYVHRLRLPVGIAVAVPADRRGDTVVVERARLRERVDVLIRQLADGRGVGVQVLLVVHDAIHRVLAPRLTHRATSAGTAHTVARDHGASLDPARRHRLRRHAVVLHRRLQLRELDAVQRPRLLLPSLSSYCRRNRTRIVQRCLDRVQFKGGGLFSVHSQ